MRVDDRIANLVDQPVPELSIVTPLRARTRRLAVHRNNMIAGLVNVLKGRFPVVEKIVGEEFFGAMAGAFVLECPPRSPVLASYGDELPEFITAFAPAHDLAYLADVARLEAAHTRAHHAADVAPLDATAFATLDSRAINSIRLKLHPSVEIVHSSHPIVTIWAMNSGALTLAPIDDWRGEDALVAPESYGSQAIVLVGFVTGLAPDLFITAMARRAFQMIKVSGAQNDPDESVLPTNLSLLMIEGLSRDKIDRLTELGIDNSQVLANQNPFILWPRLPYDLTLIVDWIAQAQLYKFAKEEGTKRLRSKGIDNICALYAALSNADAAASVAELIQVSASTVPAYITIFDQDPSFRRLREVRGALADAAPDGQPENGSGAAP